MDCEIKRRKSIQFIAMSGGIFLVLMIWMVLRGGRLHHMISAAQVAGDRSKSLVFTLRPQLTDQWCWAASGQMIMEHIGRVNIDQCTQANNRFANTGCCDCNTPGGCVRGGWPEFDKYGFMSRKTTNAALAWDVLVAQIDGNKPVAFTWKWVGNGGHMMVANGYAIINGKNFVYIKDPLPPNIGDERPIPYEEFVKGVNYTHWDDYYDVTRK
jgi:hypothetical protein